MEQEIFHDVYKLKQEIVQNLNVNQQSLTISKEEKTIVIWGQTKVNNQVIDKFITIDKVDNQWLERIQSVKQLCEEANFGGVQVNERGNILIQYDKKKSIIFTFKRPHLNSNWIYQGTLRVQDFENGNQERRIFFFENSIFVDCANILVIIQRRKCGFKVKRKEVHYHNDALNCLSYSYESQIVAQSTDSTIFFWQLINQRWSRIKPILYEGEQPPFYSYSNNKEILIFLHKSLWIVDYESRNSIEFQDDDIQNTKTQASKNNFFQLKNGEVRYWHRNIGQNTFSSEKLQLNNISDILLGYNGNVFVTYSKTEDRIKIQISEYVQQ